MQFISFSHREYLDIRAKHFFFENTLFSSKYSLLLYIHNFQLPGRESSCVRFPLKKFLQNSHPFLLPKFPLLLCLIQRTSFKIFNLYYICYHICYFVVTKIKLSSKFLFPFHRHFCFSFMLPNSSSL